MYLVDTVSDSEKRGNVVNPSLNLFHCIESHRLGQEQGNAFSE